MKVSSWQTRRSQFNHDWLKNQYLTALDKFLNILDDRIEDDEAEVNFILRVFPVWEIQADKVKSLVDDFEHEMSPATLFNSPPLVNFDSDVKEWLATLTHDLWLVRYSVREELIKKAALRIQEVDLNYNYLHQTLQENVDFIGAIPSKEIMRSLRFQFGEFRRVCFLLAQAIERFPSEILI